MSRTLYAKLWDSHVVSRHADGSALLYLDRHILHEVGTPQSFVDIERRNRALARPRANLAALDHVVPTVDRHLPMPDPLARAQAQRRVDNVARHRVPFIPLNDKRQGIVHVVAPEQGLVREQAEREGLAQAFLDAGFEWRQPGCSMCVGMNGDTLAPGQRCASTSNRNFEGRQGVGGRTHLMSPAMALKGRLADPREFPEIDP